MKNCTFKIVLSERQIKFLLLECFSFALIPPVLIYFEVIPNEWEYRLSTLSVTTVVALVALWLRFKSNLPWSDAGVTFNLKRDIDFYGPVILGCIGAFLVAPYFVSVKNEFITDTGLLFNFIGSPMQELFYRVYLLIIGALIFKPKVNFIINVALFTIMHVVYKDLQVVLPTVAVGGMFYTWLYLQRPNIVLISITHILLNALAVYVQIF